MDIPTSNNSSGSYAHWQVTMRTCACCGFHYNIEQIATFLREWWVAREG